VAGSISGAFTSASGAATTGQVAGGLGAYGGFQSPDIVANLRLDQAWGSAQVMAAGHQVNAEYYGTTPGTGGPSDKWGFVVGAGLKLNAPMLGHGDYFQAQVNYTEGALRYVFMTPDSNWAKVQGATQGYGVLTDAVYGGAAGTTGTGLDLTTGWGVNAAYDHGWNAQWKTSLYGGYAAVSYNTEANAILCSAAGNGNGLAGNAAVATAGCNNNWSTYWIGSRTQWNVTKNLYLAVDLMYSKLHSATTSDGLIHGYALTNSGATTVGDVDNWAARVRLHRDFYP
jgi:hypothetical protein